MQSRFPQSILITGASSGLGAALALHYAASGRTLFLTGRDMNRLEVVARDCRAKNARVECAAIDVREKQALAEWILKMDAITPIDLVIANAGISAGTAGGVESDAQVDAIFKTNVDGVLHTIQPIIPRMVERRSGQIAIVSSLAAYRGLPSSPAYSGSKAAVKIYGEGLRGALAKTGVGVTVITPGYIRTPMTDVNEFPMPFLVEASRAAEIIEKRLRKNPARIAFPFPLYALVWLASALPPAMTDALFSRLPGKKAIPNS